MLHAESTNVVQLHPVTESRTVPNRIANDAARGRKHLKPDEVEKLAKEARKGRHGVRDALMIRMAYEHGLRISELVGLQWHQVDLKEHRLMVKRAKGSTDATHNLQGDTIRALKRYQRETDRTHGFVFTNERGAPVSVDGFRKSFQRISERALGMKWHPHALRHACGYHLINQGVDIRTIQAYLGHRNIQNTTVYTELSLFNKLTF